MKWQLEFTSKADKQLSKLNKNTSKIIVAWLMKYINGCENPRVHGKSLTGNHAGEWCYRIGKFRVLCDIQNGRLVVLALGISHRKDVYKEH
ncbi:MAG: type II toxin-antitoxin system RelE/ParE family toxin [Dehalococcoidia bacterium]|nr:type II toxin-antitoxin system RelE/ParE family toxin [Dehalococcoidia bacterium]